MGSARDRFPSSIFASIEIGRSSDQSKKTFKRALVDVNGLITKTIVCHELTAAEIGGDGCTTHSINHKLAIRQFDARNPRGLRDVDGVFHCSGAIHKSGDAAPVAAWFQYSRRPAAHRRESRWRSDAQVKTPSLIADDFHFAAIGPEDFNRPVDRAQRNVPEGSSGNLSQPHLRAPRRQETSCAKSRPDATGRFAN